MADFVGLTPFKLDVEEQLNEISEVTGRDDVYLFTDQPPLWKQERYVFGPWLSRVTGIRNYAHPKLVYALEMVEAAHRVVTGSDAGPDAYQPSPLASTAEALMVVQDSAGGMVDVRGARVVDVVLRGNGCHVVTWRDESGLWHLAEDYHTIG